MTVEQVRAQIKDELGVEVDECCSDGVYLGHVSLEKFGLAGQMVVFKHNEKTIAAPVPLAMSLTA